LSQQMGCDGWALQCCCFDVPMRASPAQVWTALGALYIIWGSTYLGIAYVVEEFPPLVAIGWRYVAAGLVLATWLFIRRGHRAFRRPAAEYRRSIVEAVLLISIGNGVLSYGEQFVPSGVAALLVAAMPVWVAVLRTVTGDRPSLLTRFGIAVGFSGTAVLALGGGESVSGGDPMQRTIWSVLIVLSAFSWALGSFIGPRISAKRDGVVATCTHMVVGGLTMSLVGIATGERISTEIVAEVSGRAWASWVYLLVVGALAGQSIFVWLLANARISLVATYAYVNPVVAVILGWLLRGEPLTAAVVIGGSVVVSGVVLVVTGEQAKRNPEPAITE
jgi:drug/metabolite transporter (DMT)-like permease